MNFGWKLIGELAGEEQLGGTVHLYDIDKQLSLANEVIGNKLRENPSNKSNLIYLAVDTMDGTNQYGYMLDLIRSKVYLRWSGNRLQQ